MAAHDRDGQSRHSPAFRPFCRPFGQPPSGPGPVAMTEPQNVRRGGQQRRCPPVPAAFIVSPTVLPRASSFRGSALCESRRPACARGAALPSSARHPRKPGNRVTLRAAADLGGNPSNNVPSESGGTNSDKEERGTGDGGGGGGGDDVGDGAGDEQYDIPQSQVDWNAEWARFASSGMTSDAPKGREPPSRSAKVAMKAVSSVRTSVNSVTSNLPSRRALFADWRFWIAVILALSVITAAVGTSQTHPPNFV